MAKKLAGQTFVVTGTLEGYSRAEAVCYVNGTDLNAVMVTSGLALAYRTYSSDYVAQEREAEQAKRKLWAGEFVAPWDWRRGKRLEPDY